MGCLRGKPQATEKQSVLDLIHRHVYHYTLMCMRFFVARLPVAAMLLRMT